MDEATTLLDDFAAGRIDAVTFETGYLSIWRDLRDRRESWPGEKGELLEAIFYPVEAFDHDLAPGEPTDAYTLNDLQFRNEVLGIHQKLHALQSA